MLMAFQPAIKSLWITGIDDAITIEGEKKQEYEEKDKTSYYIERSYGKFQRFIPRPVKIEQDKVEAEFKKGVLTIKLPRVAQMKSKARKIEIKTG